MPCCKVVDATNCGFRFGFCSLETLPTRGSRSWCRLTTGKIAAEELDCLEVKEDKVLEVFLVEVRLQVLDPEYYWGGPSSYTNQNQQQSSSLFGGCSNNQNKSIFWSNNSIFYSFWISRKYFIRNNWRRCFFFKDLQKYPRSCQDCECRSQQRREGGNWICCRRSSRRNNICLGVTTIDMITTLLTIKMSKNISDLSTKILL